ncbi:hypothetical protein [Campylobacter jejuni]|uniref:hypothetical protein n=1 Tax=Campylobacter jejuni TaxID=197 RepID=UPI000874CF07|nr:hypothetical protein [Campylobacter jejuni]OEV67664.1 hypothetical protein AJM72_04565 [Campylobacter jejuni]OEW50359.1 hypothetical protein AJM74_05630 [Campylobacter jejuni]OEX75613.1 hypothetical protein A0K60_04090 [Campylobacter jejuni]RTJ63586.1 hypothetical protein C3H61_08345 [Campylobacter jejuni]
MNKIIVANRFDGLGERFLAFMNAIYLSNLYHYNFKFIWNSMDESNPDLNIEGVIFPSVPPKEFLFSEKFISDYYCYDYNQTIFDTSLWSYYKKNSFEVINKFFQENNILQCNLNTDMSNFFSDISKVEYRSNMASIWRNIGFSKEINSVIEYGNKIRDFLKQNYIAIHMRGGDIFYRTDVLYLCRFKALEICLSVDIIKRNKGENIVLLGNDENLNMKLKNIFAQLGYNIFTSNDLIKDCDFDVTQKAIFDIILMSNSKKLYLSGSSGFSNLAYLIGNCDKVCVYDIYSTHQKYSIIKNNLKVFDFDKYQKSFAYIHLYIYAKELKLSLSEQLFNLKEAMTTRDDAFVFKLFYVDLLLQNGQFDIAEKFFITIIDNMDKFFENLLYNGWGGAEYFLYDFVFLNYLQIKNIEKYPNLYCITYYLIFRLLKVNYIKIKDKIMFFLISNYFDRKLILECSFLKNQNEIIDFLEKEIVSSLNNYLMQTKSNKTCLLHNHLAYKLGFAYKYYSKGINKIALPFILFYIKNEHQRKKIVLEQNCFNDLETAYIYQLGKMIIKAHKTWYKGGYIKLWFEIRKLKREIKKGR